MIDTLDFVKFVLDNKPMTLEQKERFLDIAPKMTQMEKAEYVWTVLLLKAADLGEQIDEAELEALRQGKNLDEFVENFLRSQGDAFDQKKIEQLRESLRGLAQNPNPVSSPKPQG